MSSTKRTISYAIFCIVASAVFTATEANGARLKVTEYYETLCPPCRTSFTQMYKPNYEQFTDYIEFDLVPWGLSELQADGSIKCEFGEDDCLGNKYQACALKIDQNEKERLKYCVCVMSTDGVEAYTSCGQGMANFAEIEKCAKGEDGIKYSKEMGDITKKLQPPLEQVPTMFIDGKPLSDEEKDAMWNDFVSFMCGKLTSSKPPCCEGKETKETKPDPEHPASPPVNSPKPE